jgi:nitrite reductase/ring-hydroxylating ferredoxin subunit
VTVQNVPENDQGLARRAVLAGAAATGVAAALGGCQSYGGNTTKPPPGNAAGPATGGPAAGTVLAQVSDVPVGGGKILADKSVVLTQPTQGTIKGFSSICTHEGCPVSRIDGGDIVCVCHGSRFRIADGSVAAGPARQPLPPVNVTVEGGAVKLA